jgi:transcriptional repressor NrdR
MYPGKGIQAMKCPYCQYSESKVIDSRPTDEDEKIRRRRECIRCGKRFTTYEIVETTPLMVMKKDGTIEPFNREKLLNGLLRACEKRPVSLKRLEQMVDAIEQKLKNSLEGEVSSRKIGELAMEELRCIDQVAYVRFASVYREFQDINSFMEELRKILDEKERDGR